MKIFSRFRKFFLDGVYPPPYIREQTTNLEDNREKEFSKIQKFNKDSFLVDLNKIDWDKYLKIYKSDIRINFLYNKHSPLVLSKRKIKKYPSKPWLTSGIIKSIKVKKVIQTILSSH